MCIYLAYAFIKSYSVSKPGPGAVNRQPVCYHFVPVADIVRKSWQFPTDPRRGSHCQSLGVGRCDETCVSSWTQLVLRHGLFALSWSVFMWWVSMPPASGRPPVGINVYFWWMARVSDSDCKSLWSVLVFSPLGMSCHVGTLRFWPWFQWTWHFKSCFGLKSGALSEGTRKYLVSLAAVSRLTRVKVILGTGTPVLGQECWQRARHGSGSRD